MIKYPRVVVEKQKISENIKKLVAICKGSNIHVMGITKVFSGNEKIAKIMVENGVEYLGDSRIENLKKYSDIDVPKVLTRLPMKSQVEEVVRYTDISLNSELSVIELLNQEGKNQDKIHKIILMIELGDLREGILPANINNYVEKIIDMENIKLEGIGTNLTCYGGVIPSKENLGELENLTKKIEEKFKIKLEIISGGNSSSIDLLLNQEIPSMINNLRLGESLVFGRETAFGNNLKDCYYDSVRLEAEIIELKEKESHPIGEIGMNAFGEKPVFEDLGERKRAIIAIGQQDVTPNNIFPKDREIAILGASSDHTVLDITESKVDYKVGDILEFELDYSSLLQLTTSQYVGVKIK